ncbi:hypothetical protein CTAYLR_001604 [Chrysophaeum taylorii]|uniref:Cyclic nucleotide-binding domain-containing protein n=1 Tax=Chrysophaeum taylorii TaxID=2483200 RepID=A0AAD7XKW0_9STRA|nr:hypothetical protein CTAYLR_001604 [Chrysophaeum taylorii]
MVAARYNEARGVLLNSAISGVSVLYVAWSLPYRWCFLEHYSFGAKYLAWWVMDYATDVAFLAGRVIEHRAAGRLDARRVAFDVSSIVPLEVVALGGKGVILWKFNRLLRLAYAPRYFYSVFMVLEDKAKFEVGPLRMWVLFVSMAVAAHWAACLFYLAGRVDARPHRHWARQRSDTTWGQEDGLWRVSDGNVEFLVSVPHRYCRAYYWALVTMITTGFGDIVPQTRTETLVCIVSMYVGMAITCAAIANLTLLVMSSTKETLEHRSRVDAIRQYGAYRHLPEATVRRMIDFVEYRWTKLHGIDEAKFRAELPSSLRQRCVKLELYGLLRRVPALSSGVANEAFINALALRLATATYSPQDQIIRPGERLVGAILISSGEVDVISRRTSLPSSSEGGGGGGGASHHRLHRISHGHLALDAVRAARTPASPSSNAGATTDDDATGAAAAAAAANAPPSTCSSSSSSTEDLHTKVRLREGDNFGLWSLFSERQSKFLVQAHSFCEVFWLPRTVFVTVCREQCTPDQVEAMHDALHPACGDGLRVLFHAGFGADSRASQSGVHNKPRRWGKTSGTGMTSHRQRLTHSLGRVLSIGRSLTMSSFSSTTSRIHPMDMLNVDDDDAAADPGLSPRRPPSALATWLEPGTRLRDAWEITQLVVLLFHAVSIPLAFKTIYSRAFAAATPGELPKVAARRKEGLFAASYACDLVLALDFVARATILPTLDAKGVLVTRGADLRSLLLSRRRLAFYGECLALLPWDAFGIPWPVLFRHKNKRRPSHGKKSRDIHALCDLSTFALARLAKIPVLFVRLPSQTNLVLRSAVLSKQVQLIVKLNAGMILTCHWVGCLWMLAGRVSRRLYDDKTRSWIFVDRGDASSWSSCSSSVGVGACTYVRAIYFAIVAMSTVGYGDIKPDPSNVLETVYTSGVILFGGLLLPSLVGGLASLMADLNKGVREYRARVSELYQTMQRLRLSSGLQHALLQYHNYVWTRQKGVEEPTVLATLPTPLRRAVLNQTIGLAFSAAPFFSARVGVEAVAREELVSRLDPRIFLPGDVILAESDLSRLSLFLIERGSVDLYAAKAGLKALEDARKQLVAQIDLKAHEIAHLDPDDDLDLNDDDDLNKQMNDDDLNDEMNENDLTARVSKRGSSRMLPTGSPPFFPPPDTASSPMLLEPEATTTTQQNIPVAECATGGAAAAGNGEDDGERSNPHEARRRRRRPREKRRSSTSRVDDIAEMMRVKQQQQQKSSSTTSKRNSVDIDEEPPINRSTTTTTTTGSGRCLVRKKSRTKKLPLLRKMSCELKVTIRTNDDQTPEKIVPRRASSSRRGLIVGPIEPARMMESLGPSTPHVRRMLSRRRRIRLSTKLEHIKRPDLAERPVLKALCEPVMRRHAGDYFGAECLLETNQGNNERSIGPHWATALDFAATVVQEKRKSKSQKNARVDDAAAPVSLLMKAVQEEKRKSDIQAYMKLAPKMSTVASTYTDCYELSRSQFFEVLQGFPSSAAVIREELRSQCRAEHRRVRAILANIAKLHFSSHNGSLHSKHADRTSDCFTFATASEDEVCKLAICPETISSLWSSSNNNPSSATPSSARNRNAGGSQEWPIFGTTPRRTTTPRKRSSKKKVFCGRRLDKWLSRCIVGCWRWCFSSFSSSSSEDGSPSPAAGSSSSLGGGGGGGGGGNNASSSARRYSRTSTKDAAVINAMMRPDPIAHERGCKGWLRRLQFRIRRAVCDPESRGAVTWSGAMVGVVLYHAFSTPVHVAFMTRAWHRYALDWAFDVLAACDAVVVTFYLGFIRNGRLVVDPRLIYERQRQSGDLWFNLAVCFPYEVAAAGAPLPWRRAAVAFSRLPKMARLFRLHKIAYAARSLFETVEARVGSRAATLVRLLGAVVLMSHMAACSFFALARYHRSDRAEKSRWRCTWVQSQIDLGFLRQNSGFGVEDQPRQYLRALNWALPTLVVVVIGDVTPASCAETIYCFCCIALGMTVNAMIIGQVVAAVANSDASSTDLQMRADRLEKFMQLHRVPLALRCRINVFMSSLRVTKDIKDAVTGTNSNKSLAHSVLPHTLCARVCAAIRLPVLERCPIFEPCSEVLKRAIALHLVPETYSTGDLVVQCGDRGESMFFLIKGTAEVIAENGTTVYATLKPESFFGEGALFSKTIRRVATIRCTGFMETLRLARYDVQTQLKAFCFDPALLETKFNLITRRNHERNQALQENLRNARDPNHRLYKLVGLDGGASNNDGEEEGGGLSLGAAAAVATAAQQAQGGDDFDDDDFDDDDDSKKNARLPLSGAEDDARARAAWHLASIVLTLYSATAIPYRACFTLPDDIGLRNTYLAFDYACDLFFVASIFVRIHLRLYTSKWKWRLVTDLAAELPLELPVSHHRTTLGLSLRLNRLLRLWRLKAYATQLLAFASLRCGARLSAAETALATVAISYLVCNHWYACMWFAIHRYLEQRSKATWASADSVAVRRGASFDDDDGASICRVAVLDCYGRAFHMVITTISSVGYGDIKPQTPLETVWQLVVVTSGACLFASLIGAFTLWLEEIDTEGASAFNAKLQKYEAYMRKANFPTPLRLAVVANHRHRFERLSCIDVSAIAGELTAPLRMDLAYFLHRDAFDKIRVLRGLPMSTARRLADVLNTEIWFRGDNVYAVGEIGFDLYCIFRGAVSLVPPADVSLLDAHARETLLSVGTNDEDPEDDPPIPLLDRASLQRRTPHHRDDDDHQASKKSRTDEEGLLNLKTFSVARHPSAYRLVSGILYQGDHFGEYCLQSDSGVRTETASAITTLELYTVSRRDLEQQVLRFESDAVLAHLNDALQIHSSMPSD